MLCKRNDCKVDRFKSTPILTIGKRYEVNSNSIKGLFTLYDDVNRLCIFVVDTGDLEFNKLVYHIDILSDYFYSESEYREEQINIVL